MKKSGVEPIKMEDLKIPHFFTARSTIILMKRGEGIIY